MADLKGKGKVGEQEKASKAEPSYVVYVRLPFSRGDFEDPPPVDWDESKSERLWSIIRDIELATERKIDWNELAVSFGVGVEFLIMMAQTLAERHMKKVRGLLGMVPGSATPATGSGIGRPASQLSIRKETPQGSGSGTPIRTSVNVLRPQQATRNSSMNTSQKAGPQSQSPVLLRQRPLSGLQVSTAGVSKEDHDPPVRSPSPARSSSSSSSSSSDSPVESRIIKRPPRYKSTFDKDEGEDEDSEPAFLPYRGTGASAGSSGATTTQDLGATLRGDPKASRRQAPGTSSVVSEAKTETTNQSQTSDSSTSSSQVLREQQFRYRQPPGPLSPRRTAELAGRSPRGRVTREGSDGTPSMGSSFSDLDDASVTQSALEEALASRMQDGGGTIGSRMSTFGAAIRSRYLPKGNQGGQNPQP